MSQMMVAIGSVFIVMVFIYEHWTGLGLDWIRTIANFVELGLDLDYTYL